MDRAFAEADSGKRAEAIGQTLELIRHAGPPAIRTEPELETLIASLARYWPSELRSV